MRGERCACKEPVAELAIFCWHIGTTVDIAVFMSSVKRL